MNDILKYTMFIWLVSASCSGNSVRDTDAGADADTDSDSDTDTDTDSDSDSDGDAGKDSGGDNDCTQPKAVPNCKDGWCRIDPGCFIWGSPYGEPCRGAYDETQVQVTLTKPYLMSQHEVTQKEWKAAGFPNPSRDVDPQKPVSHINWFEAAAYANKLSEAAGLATCYELKECQGTIGSGCPDGIHSEWCTLLDNDATGEIYNCKGDPHKYDHWATCPGYRLPTSAEWEYAARAGTTTATYNGALTTTDGDSCKKDPTLEPIAWYCFNSGLKMQTVCGKQPNGWGLCDMLGNTEEWVDYVYTGFSLSMNEGQEGPLIDPQGAHVKTDEKRRSLRGGNFYLAACFSCASRKSSPPLDNRVLVNGIRLVRTIFEDSSKSK